MHQLVAAVLVPLALAVPHRGFNFTTWWHDEYASPHAARSLSQLAGTGANSVALVPSWYQRSRRSTRIGPDADRSPTDQSLAIAVARAQDLGLQVFLRPTVETQDGTPRAELRPRSPSAWFRSYRRFIRHYARLAQRLGVDMLSVGLEYRSLDGPSHARSWRRVIRTVRARFNGRLTYGANGADAWTRVRFWGALDVIGVDAYFPLSDRGTPSAAQIARRWGRFTDRFGVTHRYLGQMRSLARAHRKPIVLTELGYPSSVRAAAKPWSTGGRYSGAAQRRALDGAFRALSRQRWFAGLYIWEWNVDPRSGGRGDTGHTPQGKPAERSIASWFRRLGP
jgi:hypothetical protein